MASKIKVAQELFCTDPALRHDWDLDGVRWESGPDLKRGHRTIYVHYRVMVCKRCHSIRREVFDQADDSLTKRQPNGNRYQHSELYKHRQRLELTDLYTQMWRTQS